MTRLLDRFYIPKEIVKENVEPIFTYTIDAYTHTQVHKTYKYLKNYLVIPSGSWHKVKDKLKTTEVEDMRKSHVLNDFPDFSGNLWEDQQVVVSEFLELPEISGFIHSKAGSGKTVMACNILSKLKQRFLIIVPTSLLLNQWVERLEEYLPGIRVAKLGQGYDTFDEEHHGLVAIINSIQRNEALDKYREMFGTIIMDEAHRLPANTYQKTINRLAALHKIGLSANTTRKDNKHVMIEDFLGPYSVYNKDPKIQPAKIIIVNSGFNFIFLPTMNWARTLNDICGNLEYNQIIAERVRDNVAEGRKVAVLTPRLFQIDLLQELLERMRVGIIVGSTKEQERNKVIEDVNNGDIDVLLCSKQIFEEGVDIKRLDTIHLVAPSNNDEKLEQAIGRVERIFDGKKEPLVYDYWHMAPTPNSFHKQQKARLQFYEGKGHELVSEQWLREKNRANKN